MRAICHREAVCERSKTPLGGSVRPFRWESIDEGRELLVQLIVKSVFVLERSEERREWLVFSCDCAQSWEERTLFVFVVARRAAAEERDHGFDIVQSVKPEHAVVDFGCGSLERHKALLDAPVRVLQPDERIAIAFHACSLPKTAMRSMTERAQRSPFGAVARDVRRGGANAREGDARRTRVSEALEVR